jgi:hypothetical protein
MALIGKPTIVDSSGQSHDWRTDLVAALAKRQNANGSWVNPADSFMEGAQCRDGLRAARAYCGAAEALRLIRKSRADLVDTERT